MNELPLPDFLGVGAVKAGTTWLYRNLGEHPEVYMPVLKPVRYFDRHAEKPIESYSAIFRPGAGRLKGEFTASYSVLPLETIDYIRRLMPHAKVIFLMREPKARAWSEAKMEFSVIRGLGETPASDDEYYEFLGSEQCRSRGDYRAILTNWQKFFPPSQIFIGLTDDIREQPEDLLVRVFRFLGISPTVDCSAFPLREKIFAGRPIEIPDRCRRLLDGMYGAEEIKDLEAFVGMKLVQRWGYD
jgi:hypothetical protein